MGTGNRPINHQKGQVENAFESTSLPIIENYFSGFRSLELGFGSYLVKKPLASPRQIQLHFDLERIHEKGEK